MRLKSLKWKLQITLDSLTNSKLDILDKLAAAERGNKEKKTIAISLFKTWNLLQKKPFPPIPTQSEIVVDFKRNLVIKKVHIMKAVIKYGGRGEQSIHLYKLLNKYAVLLA